MGTWLVLWATRGAEACGGLVHDEESLAESDTAEAILEGGTWEGAPASLVSYEVTWQGDAADFGWVLPVPGAFLGLADAEPARFEDLRWASQPVVVYPDDGGASAPAGCGCGGASKGGDLSSGGTRGDGSGVTVVAEGFTGTYEYVAIAGDDPEALQGWFEEHGWTGLDAGDLAHYQELGATFVALRVLPGAATGSAAQLPPVTLAYDGPLLYPAAMLGHATVPDQRTTLYVLGDARAALGGWSSEDVPEIAGDANDDPLDLFEDALLDRGVDRTYVRTWAGAWYDAGAPEGVDPERFLTRFDARSPTGVHTVDVDVAFEGGADATRGLTTRILLGASSGAPTGSAWPTPGWLAPATLLAALARRRRGRPGGSPAAR